MADSNTCSEVPDMHQQAVALSAPVMLPALNVQSEQTLYGRLPASDQRALTLTPSTQHTQDERYSSEEGQSWPHLNSLIWASLGGAGCFGCAAIPLFCRRRSRGIRRPAAGCNAAAVRGSWLGRSALIVLLVHRAVGCCEDCVCPPWAACLRKWTSADSVTIHCFTKKMCEPCC